MKGVITIAAGAPWSKHITYDRDTLDVNKILGCTSSHHCRVPHMDKHGYKLSVYWNSKPTSGDVKNVPGSILTYKGVIGDALIIDDEIDITDDELDNIFTHLTDDLEKWHETNKTRKNKQ